jgi:hypothetical protein
VEGQNGFAQYNGGAKLATSLPASDAAAPGVAVAAANGNRPLPGAAAKVFPVPARNYSITTPSVLPPPTTGPGALPGGHSMALDGQATPVSADPGQNFTGAFTQALDKYRAAQRLGNGAAQPAADVEPAEADDEAETATH